MKKAKTVAALVLAVLMMIQLFGCAVNIPVPEDISSLDEAEAIGLFVPDRTKTMVVGDYLWLDVNIKIDYTYALKWSSNNPEIATVDSNGRVDAIAPGKAIITAKVEKSSVDYEITVKEAKHKSEVNTSNAIIADKNKLLIDQNKMNVSNVNLYAMIVNVDSGCITVYTYNSQGVYNVGVRSMVCSTAKDSSVYDMYENNNPDETVYYHVTEKVGNSKGWNSDEKDEYYRYRTNFSLNDTETLSFTSCAYSKKSPSSLITKDYNKLGTAYTKGDIRLSVSDAKWIYDNCTEGTQIRFVDGDSRDTLGVPVPIRIAPECDVQNWDPTDPDEKNPFSKKAPTFKGMEDITITAGSVCDLKSGVEVYDIGMNLLAASYKTDGTVLRDKVGDYIITYYYKDTMGRTGRADRVVHVVNR